MEETKTLYEIEQLKDEIAHQKKAIDRLLESSNKFLRKLDKLSDEYEEKDVGTLELNILIEDYWDILGLIENFLMKPAKPRHPILYMDAIYNPLLSYLFLKVNDKTDADLYKRFFINNPFYSHEEITKEAQEQGVTVFWNIVYQ